MGRIAKTLVGALVGATLFGATGFGLMNYCNKLEPREVSSKIGSAPTCTGTYYYKDDRWQTDGEKVFFGDSAIEIDCAVEEMAAGAVGVGLGTLVGGTLGFALGRKREEKPVEAYD